jgi:hypothetical protein
MALFPRYFTLSEAEGLIPRLEALMGEIQAVKRRIEKRLEEGRAGSPLGTADQAILQGKVDFLVAQLNVRLDEVVQLGCQPKDLEVGLVDFPARLDGREINLCWRLGERRINFWHGLDEGFSGRKPLDPAARAAL